MATNQQPSKNKGWTWVIIAILLGVAFLGLLAYSVNSDNKDINQYAKQWRSTGDKEASMPMDMQHGDMHDSDMKNMDMSNMSQHDMPASEMQHMDMSDMQHKKQ